MDRAKHEERRYRSWTRIAACFFLLQSLIVCFVLFVERGSLVFELKHTLVGVFGVSSVVLLFILSCCGIPNERINLVSILGLCVAFYLFGIGTDSISHRIASLRHH